MSDPLRWRWPLGALAVCLFAILLLEDFVIGGEPITLWTSCSMPWTSAS